MQTIDTVNPTILLAIELSASTWLVAARVPGWEKPHLHRIDGGDTAALLALISSLQARAARGLDATIGFVCCFEAGRDGFWLHRLLTAHGVVCHVLEPTSILVNRRARRAKTDRLDAEGMLRVLAAYLRGDHQTLHHGNQCPDRPRPRVSFNAVLLKELRMIALLRQVADPGNSEGAQWAGMRIHRIASELLTELGASSKLNAEWEFFSLLRDEGRRSAQVFLESHASDLGRRSTLDLDVLLEKI